MLATKLVERSGLSSTPVQTQGGIMTALSKLIEVSKESLSSAIVQKISQIAINNAKSSDWQVRKASIVLMHAFMMLVSPQDRASSQDAMFKTLKDLKFDRTPPVRDSASSALKSLHEAGIDPAALDPGAANGKLKRNTADASQPPLSKVAGNFTFIPLNTSPGHSVVSPIRAAVEGRTPKKYPKIDDSNDSDMKDRLDHINDDDDNDLFEEEEKEEKPMILNKDDQNSNKKDLFGDFDDDDDVDVIDNNNNNDSKDSSFDSSSLSTSMNVSESTSDKEVIRRLNLLEKQQSEMFFLFRQKTERMELMIGEMKDSINRMETLLSALSSRLVNPVASPKPTSSWDKALGLLSEERVDEAFRCVLESNDPQTLFKLMDISGPSIQSLKSETLYELLNQTLPHMKDDSICRKNNNFHDNFYYLFLLF